jgi:hypothetical protein
MDFFQSHQTVPKPLLSYLLPYSRTFNCTSKTTGWFTKGLKLIPTCHANKVLLQGSTHSIYMDGLLSVTKLCPSRCYLTFFHIPERSIALVKRLAGSPKGWNWSQPAHANKVLLQGSTRILIYIDGLLSVAQTVPKPLLSYLLPYSQRSIALVTTGWFTKGLKLIPTCPTLTKCYSKVAHAFLYTWMDFFHRTKLCPSRCYLTFFHIPERSIALVKRLAGSPKGWNWSQPATLTKCYSKVAHAFLYTWMDFFQSHQLCPSRCYLTFFHIRTFNCTSKRLAGSPKGLKLIPTCPR